MKKQIVAILAIIAVVTTLFTVSAFSNEVGYKLSLCDAIVISIGNATVTDFLNATNMTTVQVYNSKRYEGDNLRMVQWSSSDSSLDVYVNVATGYIEGIEKITVPEALKAWVAVNYGDGTRVTSDSADKLSLALMLSSLAPLPTGYTSADITEDVWKWARNNVGWTSTVTPPYTPPVTPPGTGKPGSIPIIVNSAMSGCVLQLASFPGGADYWIDGYPPGARSGVTKDYSKQEWDYLNLSCGDHSVFVRTPDHEDIEEIITVSKGLNMFIAVPDQTPSVTPTPTPDPKPCWHTVNTFQGRYDKRTPSFTIKGDTWRMNWETVGREDTSSIAVSVYKVLMYNEWADYFSQDTFPSGADTYCVYTGAGTYYLGISANDLEYWSIEIEDFY